MTEASYPPHSPPQPSSTHPPPALFSSPQLRCFPSRRPDVTPSSHGRRVGAALQARRPSPRRGPLSARPLPGVALWAPPPSAPPLPDTALLGASLTVRRPSRAQPSRRAGPPEHGGSRAPSQSDVQICSSKRNHIRAVAAPSAASFQWPR